MPNTREKLIEVLGGFDIWHKPMKECWMPEAVERLADHLIANGVTVQKWIPVTERLPEQDGKYLVCKNLFGDVYIKTVWFAKDARKVDKFDFRCRWKNVWYDYDNEWGHYEVGAVTHWMPLPEPPEEVKK